MGPLPGISSLEATAQHSRGLWPPGEPVPFHSYTSVFFSEQNRLFCFCDLEMVFPASNSDKLLNGVSDRLAEPR